MDLKKRLTGSVLAASLLVGVPLGGIAFARQTTLAPVTQQRVAVPARQAAQQNDAQAQQPQASDAAEPNEVAEPNASSEPAEGAETGEQDQQEPSYTGSITVPQDHPAGQSEADEAAARQSLAKISADQAQAAAIKANPGTTASKVELDNENGVLVYSVHLSNGLDVKVDAGNGAILYTDQEDGNEIGEQDEASEAGEQGETPDAGEQGGVEDAPSTQTTP